MADNGCLLAAFAFAQNQVKLRVRFSLNNLKLDDDVLIPLFQADQADRLIRQALRIRGQAGIESKRHGFTFSFVQGHCCHAEQSQGSRHAGLGTYFGLA